MNYLKAEMLKYKRSFANKILVIAPICTGLFAWVVGGFIRLSIYDFCTGGMRFCYREQSLFSVILQIRKKNEQANIFLCFPCLFILKNSGSIRI